MSDSEQIDSGATPVDQLHPELPVVSCNDLACTYGTGTTSVVAVHGVNCAVPPRARLAISGPSGSGKSTLLHLMAGLETPTHGNISWPGLGGNPRTQPGLVGVVFQGPSLIPALDVIENVALPLVINGSDDDQAREKAHKALVTLDLDDLATKLPEELSGGQSQRVAIARVLAVGPLLILADEPTGQLDRAAGIHIVDVLVQAANTLDAALVISTHDPVVVDRLELHWRMRDGSITTNNNAYGKSDSPKVGRP